MRRKLGSLRNISICNRWGRNNPLTVTDRDKGRTGPSHPGRARISGHTSVDNLPLWTRWRGKVGDYPRSISNGRKSTLDFAWEEQSSVWEARSRPIYRCKRVVIEVIFYRLTPLRQSVPSGNVTAICKFTVLHIQTQQNGRSKLYGYARSRVSRGFR